MASKPVKTVPIKGMGSAGSSPAHIPRLQASAPPADPQTLTLEMLQQALQVTQEKLAILINEKINETNEKIQVVSDEIATRNQQIRDDIIKTFKCLAGNIEMVDDKVEEVKQSTVILDNKLDEAQNRIQRAEDDVAMIQYRDMEFALRFRGVKENKQENLREMMSEAGTPKSPKSPEGKRKKDVMEGEKEELLTVVQGGVLTGEEPLQIQMAVQELELIDLAQPKDQRQTRLVTARLKEVSRQQQFQMATQETIQESTKTEAVGGARPKGQMRQDHQNLLQLLQGPRDGN
ncbi:tropomyosin-like [Pituophis catenifer annectens]|uniref:tropomyosin-like n=1 Tax=Pituophis catenifer annectens TaxID=94852 RepID=UPI00399650D4